MKRFLVVISGIVTSLVAFGQSLAIAPSKPVSAADVTAPIPTTTSTVAA
jgi:hypothetical protein